MTSGSCEFVDRVRQIVLEACQDDGAPAAVADRVEQMIREEFGALRVYIPALPDGKKDEAVRLLRQGMDPERVAVRLSVHVSTVYRWRRVARKRRSRESLGKPDWVL